MSKHKPIVVGDVFGELVIKSECKGPSYVKKNGYTTTRRKWTCLCSCGKMVDVLDSNLKSKTPTRSCGHLNVWTPERRARQIKTIRNSWTLERGARISEVVKASWTPERKAKQRKFWKKKWYTAKYQEQRSERKAAKTKSSNHSSPRGVYDSVNTSPLYSTWTNMMIRTQNKASRDYAKCGGIGIKLYQPWIDNFRRFEKWVVQNLGMPTENETIRRIDINKNFEPSNMELATKTNGRRTHQQTAPEKILAELLDGRTFKYTGVGKAKYGQPISADFVVPRLRFIIQVDGCYWHGCELHSTRTKKECKKLQKKDARLTSKAEDEGWIVLRIWEHDVINSPAKVVKKILKISNNLRST